MIWHWIAVLFALTLYITGARFWVIVLITFPLLAAAEWWRQYGGGSGAYRSQRGGGDGGQGTENTWAGDRRTAAGAMSGQRHACKTPVRSASVRLCHSAHMCSGSALSR